MRVTREPGHEIFRVTVEVPRSVGDSMIDGLFTAVADAVSDWEPDERDGWDADVFGAIVAEDGDKT